MENLKSFTGRVFLVLLMISAFYLFGIQFSFVLLIFASILFAVLISYGANGLNSKLKIHYGLSVALVLLSIGGLLFLIIRFIGPSLSAQISEMQDTLPKSLEALRSRLNDTTWGKKLMDEIPSEPGKLIGSTGETIAKITGMFSATIGVLANILIVLIAGIFLASAPETYRHGLVRLFPISYRRRVDEVLIECYKTLSTWLMAKFISMAVVGIATAVGLLLLGVPMPFALALIAFFFAFIPNIGPYIALVPAVLIGIMEGNNMALYIVILYFGIQIVESYLLTPLVEKKMVSIPPALMLLWQVMMGLFAGIIGLFLATPILAAIIVLVKEFYIKDKLEKNIMKVEP